MSSSPSIPFLRSKLQTTHRWAMTYSPPLISTLIGSISPPHSDARSPGFTSTCRDQRHFGQWLVYPFPPTKYPQWLQEKSSIFRWNCFVGRSDIILKSMPPRQMRARLRRRTIIMRYSLEKAIALKKKEWFFRFVTYFGSLHITVDNRVVASLVYTLYYRYIIKFGNWY